MYKVTGILLFLTPLVSEAITTEIETGDTVSYELLMLKGQLDVASESVVVTSNNTSTSWRVSSDKNFIAFVPLSDGDNAIVISASNNTSKSINVNYSPKETHFGVKFTYLLSADGDGSFRAGEDQNNDLESMKKRMKTKATLMQSIFAEMMFEAGYGRQTFNIIKDDASSVDYVSVKTLGYSDAELYEYNDVENQVENTPYPLEKLYSIVKNNVSNNSHQLKHMVTLGMSKVDEEGVRYASTALGGTDLALVDNLSLYTVPENVLDLTTALYDQSIVFSNDNKESRIALGVSVIAAVHELSHAFGLGHIDENRIFKLTSGKPTLIDSTESLFDVDENTQLSIMGYGLYSGLNFLTVETPDGVAIAESEVPNLRWGYLSAGSESNSATDTYQNSPEHLSKSPWFNDSSNLIEYTIEAENTAKVSSTGSAKIDYVAAASGSQMLVWFNDEIVFDDIYTNYSGTYKLSVAYSSPDDRQFQVYVNNEYVETVSVSSSNNEINSAQLNIDLSNGLDNSITLKAIEWGPDIDSITLSSLASISILSREAESSLNDIGGQGYVGSSVYASDGELVKGLGGSISFNNLNVEKSDNYRLKITNGSWGDRYSGISIYGSSCQTLGCELGLDQGNIVSFPGLDTWTEMGEKNQNIYLEEGNNRIVFDNGALGNFWMADFDKIDLIKDVNFMPPAVTIEAEDSSVILSESRKASFFGAASGGQVVKSTAVSGTITFSHVAESSGTYWITIYYVSAEQRSASLNVNGELRVINFEPTENWETTGAHSEIITLNEGYNEIVIEDNQGAWTPDIDKIYLHQGRWWW